MKFKKNTLLRVLIPLLKNTELNKTHYRREDLSQLLNYLCVFDNITSEHKLTVKLAFKCLNEIPWLNNVDKLDNEIIKQNSSYKRASSMSAMSRNNPTIFNRRKTNDSDISLPSLSNSIRNSNFYNNSTNIGFISRNSQSHLNNSNRLYNMSSDVYAESLWERKNKPTPPPPPPRLRKTVLTTSISNDSSNSNINNTDYSRNVN